MLTAQMLLPCKIERVDGRALRGCSQATTAFLRQSSSFLPLRSIRRLVAVKTKKPVIPRNEQLSKLVRTSSSDGGRRARHVLHASPLSSGRGHFITLALSIAPEKLLWIHVLHVGCPASEQRESSSTDLDLGRRHRLVQRRNRLAAALYFWGAKANAFEELLSWLPTITRERGSRGLVSKDGDEQQAWQARCRSASLAWARWAGCTRSASTLAPTGAHPQGASERCELLLTSCS